MDSSDPQRVARRLGLPEDDPSVLRDLQTLSQKGTRSKVSDDVDVGKQAGKARLHETAQAMRTVGISQFGEMGIGLIPELHRRLDNHEALCAIASAKVNKVRMVLVLTDHRVLAINPGTDEQFEFPLGAWSTEAKNSIWTGVSLLLRRGGEELQFREYTPLAEMDRIFFSMAMDADIPAGLFEALPSNFSREPPGPPIAGLWNILVYEDRIIDHEMRHLPFDGEVSAMADAAGTIAATRGRNLAAKGAGTLLLGPIGLFGMGNAKHRTVDNRELYLLVEGAGWAYTQAFNPNLGGELRNFAQQINVVAKRHLAENSAASSGASETSLVAELQELTKLRAEGGLSDEEFAQAKKLLLDNS